MIESILVDLRTLGDPAVLVALVQVVVIDLALASENAIVVGALVAGLPQRQRRKALILGVGAALVLRVGFSLIATRLLRIVGVVLAGGLLLLWVAWKMWRETARTADPDSPLYRPHLSAEGTRSLTRAAGSVALADLGMSLDNVLGVAGAAKDHPGILIIGLGFSVALMGIAANLVATFIERFRWIAWIGIGVVLWVAGVMIWNGLMERDLGILRRHLA